MKTIKFNEIQTFELKNKSTIGIDIVSLIQHTTVNVPFAADVLVLENIQVKTDLIRNGQTINILNDNLRNLFAHSVYLRALWRSIAGSQDLTARVQVVAAGAVKEILNVPFVVLFPSIINLRGTDELRTTINLPSSAAAATVDTAASYLSADYMEGVGVEYGIPQIKSYVLQANQNNESVSLGSGVVDVKFFNFDKKSYLTANRVLTNLQITSDKYQRNDTDLELQAKSLLGDFIPATTFEPYQSIQVYQGLELHDAQLELQLVSANINASKNVVVWSVINTNSQSIERGLNTVAKHKKKNSFRLFG